MGFFPNMAITLKGGFASNVQAKIELVNYSVHQASAYMEAYMSYTSRDSHTQPELEMAIVYYVIQHNCTS